MKIPTYNPDSDLCLSSVRPLSTDACWEGVHSGWVGGATHKKKSEAKVSSGSSHIAQRRNHTISSEANVSLTEPEVLGSPELPEGLTTHISVLFLSVQSGDLEEGHLCGENHEQVAAAVSPGKSFLPEHISHSDSDRKSETSASFQNKMNP